VLETLRYLERLTSYGVGWKSYTEQYLDSAGVFKDAIISIMATLTKQERIKISERTLAGLETARALGRPKKIFDRERLVRLRTKEGWSLGRLSQEFRISRTNVARIVQGSNPCPAGSLGAQESVSAFSQFQHRSAIRALRALIPYFFCSTKKWKEESEEYTKWVSIVLSVRSARWFPELLTFPRSRLYIH
jgi:hypothetical protein